jgi:hypothetical protein
MHRDKVLLGIWWAPCSRWREGHFLTATARDRYGSRRFGFGFGFGFGAQFLPFFGE